MLKFIKLIISIALLNLIINKVNAQNAKVITTNIEVKDNKLIVDYKFDKSKKNQKFDVWLEVTTIDDRKLEVKTLDGDHGSNINGEGNKQITWDFWNDGIVLNEEVNVEVLANINVIGPGMSKALLLSAIVPGLGATKVDGKPYWLMGVIGYGTLASSILFNQQSISAYNSYLEEPDINASDSFFNDSKQKDLLSKSMAYTATGIWCLSMIITAIKAKKSNSSIAEIYNNKKLFFTSGINPQTKIASFNLKYQF